eukprot:SAG11_NODE_6_length_32111_cov_33.703174_14_plen_56_part_00
MRTQTPTKRVYLLDPNEVDNLALDGTGIQRVPGAGEGYVSHNTTRYLECAQGAKI